MTMYIRRLLVVLAVTSCISAGSVAADRATVRRVGFHPAEITGPALLAPDARKLPPALVREPGVYVFAVAPRETAAVAQRIYQPIAEHLSEATGRKVVFHHADNWLTYQAEMQRGDYDLVLDDPHFNGWRAANLQHNVLVKAPGNSDFVVIVKQENAKVRELKQLAGRSICAMSPPNLGTLTVLNEFENPMRQPLIQSTQGWDTIYNHLQSGRCTAAILPLANLVKYDPHSRATRVVFKAKTYPNQALSAGPRVAAGDQARITLALISPTARTAMAGMRELYALIGDFQTASRDDYLAAASLLTDAWGMR